MPSTPFNTKHSHQTVIQHSKKLPTYVDRIRKKNHLLRIRSYIHKQNSNIQIKFYRVTCHVHSFFCILQKNLTDHNVTYLCAKMPDVFCKTFIIYRKTFNFSWYIPKLLLNLIFTTFKQQLNFLSIEFVLNLGLTIYVLQFMLHV